MRPLSSAAIICSRSATVGLGTQDSEAELRAYRAGHLGAVAVVAGERLSKFEMQVHPPGVHPEHVGQGSTEAPQIGEAERQCEVVHA